MARQLKAEYIGGKEIIIAIGRQLFTLNGKEREQDVPASANSPSGKRSVKKLTPDQIEMAFADKAPLQLQKLRRFFTTGSGPDDAMAKFLAASSTTGSTASQLPSTTVGSKKAGEK